MKKILFIYIIVCLFFTEVSGQPNFVFFIADDCSYWDIGCYGSKDSQTPNIDKLASQGMLFTNSFQAAPMCSPTRHNIYTGQYPVKTGAYPNHTFVKKGTKSIVQYLKPLGYRMALSGKRHINPKEIFDFEYIGKSNKNPDYEAVEAFLKDAKKNKEPYCLFLCSNEPHTPWDKGDPEKFDQEEITLPPFFVDTKETREAFCSYLAEINYMDGQVGEAMALLKKLELDINTVFVFTSEQGNSFPFAKWTCYNAGLHNAYIVRWPGNTKPGSTSSALIDYTDITPTFIDIAGGVIPKELDGLSIKKVLRGETKKHKDYSFGLQTTRGINSGSEKYAIRSVTDGKYRLIINLNYDEKFKNAVTESNSEWWISWKRSTQENSKASDLINAYQIRPEFELYDCIKDPYNMENLSGKIPYREIEEKLKKKLYQWMEECGDKGTETEMEANQHQKRGG